MGFWGSFSYKNYSHKKTCSLFYDQSLIDEDSLKLKKVVLTVTVALPVIKPTFYIRSDKFKRFIHAFLYLKKKTQMFSCETCQIFKNTKTFNFNLMLKWDFFFLLLKSFEEYNMAFWNETHYLFVSFYHFIFN